MTDKLLPLLSVWPSLTFNALFDLFTGGILHCAAPFEGDLAAYSITLSLHKVPLTVQTDEISRRVASDIIRLRKGHPDSVLKDVVSHE